MSGKTLRLIALFCLSFVVVGCNTMHVETNKDPNYQANIHRLVIVENLGGASFQGSLDKNLTSMINACGAKPTFVNLVQIIKDPSHRILKKDANGISYDALLTIEMTSSDQLTRYGAPVGTPTYHYTLTLIDPGSGKKVWKALMTFVTGNVILSDKGQLLASDIITQMNKDGLFTECVPKDPN